MVTHAKLQYYKQNYCLVCMTGLLGCRWHRYKQSTRDSRKRDLVVFTLLLLTFLFVDFLLYYSLIAKNDADSLNWYMFFQLKKWISTYVILMAVFVTLFCYLLLLMILSICHVINRHQLYTHPVHAIFVVLCLCICIAATVTLDKLWNTEWAVIWLSLKITGPFLQIGAVTIMTALTWIIARQWLTLSSCCLQFLWLAVYLVLMSGLYISPLLIDSPCVKVITDIPPKPKIFGHRGASELAPENTLTAFQTAIDYNIFGLEADIKLSYDGVPFVFHDKTFRRTTNIADVFPSNIDHSVTAFNISEVKSLNAGLWFLEIDPFGTVGDLSEEQKTSYNNLTIPTFEELLTLVNKTDQTLLVDISTTSTWHPFYDQTTNIYMDVIKKSGIPKSRIWVTGDHRQYKNVTSIPLSEEENPVTYILHNNFTHVNIAPHELSTSDIKLLMKNNVTTVVYLVNTVLFYSFYWCMGMSAVTSDTCHILSKLDEPIWHLPPRNYLILWIAVDVLSILAVITIFIVQRINQGTDNFNPESLSLNNRSRISGSFTSTRSRRSMKEKLLMKDVAEIFDDPDAEDYGIEANYTVQSMDGQAMARQFHSTRHQQDDRIELT